MKTMTDTYQWKGAFGSKIIEKVFTPLEVSEMLKEARKMSEEVDRKNYIWKYYENEKISRIEYFVKYNKYMSGLSKDERIIRIVENAAGESMTLFKDKINFKYPNQIGFSPHQDITAGWGKYANFHVSVAIPLCDTNEKNGCIHFSSAVDRNLTNNFEDITENLEYQPHNTRLGDVIVFDSFVPHVSYVNKTSKSRPIIFFTYIPTSRGEQYENYHNDKFLKVPPDISKVPGEMYKINNSNEKEFFFRSKE